MCAVERVINSVYKIENVLWSRAKPDLVSGQSQLSFSYLEMLVMLEGRESTIEDVVGRMILARGGILMVLPDSIS